MSVAETPARQRIAFWDNARFASVTLVVIGHGIQRLTAESDTALAVYLFIYAFHMPAFALISGYFSRASPPTTKRMKRLINDMLLPYLIMETIWTGLKFIVEGNGDFNPTSPSWTLWFLLALAIFRLILPYLVLLRWPLFLAFALSVFVGYFPNVDSTFSLSRAIGILPFFVLGWRLRQWGLAERLLEVGRGIWIVRAAAGALFLTAFAVIASNIDFWREMNLKRWLFYDDSYAALGGFEWTAGLIRLALVTVAIVLSASFLVLMPRRETWMTAAGRATMYVYLLHSFVLYPLRETGVMETDGAAKAWLVAMVFAGVAISTVLATPFVRRVFRPLIEPRPRWLFSEDSLREPRFGVDSSLVKADAFGQHKGQRERNNGKGGAHAK